MFRLSAPRMTSSLLLSFFLLMGLAAACSQPAADPPAAAMNPPLEKPTESIPISSPAPADAAIVRDLLTATIPSAAPLVVEITVTSTPALAALLPTPTPAGTALIVAEQVSEDESAPSIKAAEATSATGVVNAALVNVRGGPGVNYAVLTTVTQGRRLALQGRTEDGRWLQFCCVAETDTPGWISAELLDGVDPAPLPPVEPPPTPLPTAEPGAAQVASSAGEQNAAALAAAPASGLPGSGGFGPAGGVNPLTGLPLPGGRSGQRPIIVCINNDFAARPQFGISQADVMYEYLMEGYGITRFSGVFYGDDVAQIGPVRSARLINYYMGSLYGAGLACSGASDRVRFMLKHEAPFPYLDVDLDDPSNTRYTVSIGSDYRTRLRTSIAGLRRWLADWGVEQPAAVRGFTFGDPPGGGSPASAVSIPYPGGTGSQVSYGYDGGSGRYLRFMGGAPHLDGNSGGQVGVENVIIQYAPHETTDIVEDSLGSLSIRLNLYGSGRAILLRDGMAYDGTWRSDSQGDLPRFYAADGAELSLKPGRTWISVVPLDYAIRWE
ncbi:MAG: DUF3048 domain-containing protein [Caldilineaceae bacterium]|nr:DUF3048 domain-containing protein [Caldilineaceae bacterium]